MTKIVVFLGPPGAGKGTQASLLAQRRNAKHISTGALLRQEISSGSVLGKKVKSVVESGALVNDDLLFQCMGSQLEHLKSAEILLLDGVPRTANQIGILDETLQNLGLEVNKVIALTAPLEKLVARFSSRFTCTKCGSVGAFASVEDAHSKSCPSCAAVGTFARRADDAPEAVQRRLLVYESETKRLLDFYRQRGIVTMVDALQPIEVVYQEINRDLS